MPISAFSLSCWVILACFAAVAFSDPYIDKADIANSILISDSGLYLNNVTLEANKCVNIESHDDQCAFVQSTCHGFSGMYLKLYYCSPLWKPVTITLLSSVLLLLFGAVSVVASDFFCPNLQTISSKLQLSESMAGVTVLAFGNGSPDLFSTFSAMNSGSGSLAIGELIGAAFFIVAVVSGTMGIIRPFQSKRITFMRDATFLTGAIMMITWIVYHQRIYWFHGVALVAYYLIYVSVVMLGAVNFQGKQKIDIDHPVATIEIVDETTSLLNGSLRQPKPPRLSIPIDGFVASSPETHLGHIIRPLSARSLSRYSLQSSGFPRTTSTNGSISSRLVRQPMTPRVGIRTSLFGAIEFQQHVSAIRRANSSNVVHQPAVPRQRQISMPHHWSKRTISPATTATHLRTNSAPRMTGRPRASTLTDRLMPRQVPEPTTPESTNSSTGLAEDYFTYLSANQHKEFPAGMMVASDHSDLMIPEIRLAPPNNNTALESPPSRRQCTSFTSNRGVNTSLHVPHSPSIANTDDDIFVSARQSPAITPSPSMYNYDHRSISIAFTRAHNNNTNDNSDEYPFVQITLDSHFAEPRCIISSLSQLTNNVRQILFPTMQDWCSKSWFAKLSSFVAVPLVLVFTLTLPVAEPDGGFEVQDIQVIDDDDDEDIDDGASATSATVVKHASYLAVESALNTPEGTLMGDIPQAQPWCRWLLAVQAIFGSIFLAIIMAINEFIDPIHIIFGFAMGCLLAAMVFIGTDADKPPRWAWMLSFAGFFVALNWIFFLANNMVGLLKALGMVFNISDAIMGLTVFALGNSIGDFVANTAIAKMGFPTMAISACYAGPLLNMVLGVGISSTYQIFKTGKPYQLDIAPTILVSAAGLITVLLSTLIMVNLNGYFINQYLGYWMISVYIICCIINVILEWGAV
ncbi:Sodium/calcium exchanger protein-domain-containing protein [Dichotomocladium elegans]|nr:Sodium/calcium exchanger protein-domain-containing protein [Dichotomocladium elegans]